MAVQGVAKNEEDRKNRKEKDKKRERERERKEVKKVLVRTSSWGTKFSTVSICGAGEEYYPLWLSTAALIST